MTCYGISGAYGHPEVRCGYFPWRATQPTTVTSRPGGGVEIAPVVFHGGVALQSARNPTGSDSPPRRVEYVGSDGNTHVWAYERHGGHSGFVRRDLIEVDPEAALHQPADGPDSQDFEVGRQPCPPSSQSGCGRVSKTQPLMVVTAETLHFRYSPRGTSRYYLHAGEEVRVLIALGPHGYVFAEVTRTLPGRGVRAGMRGWVLMAYLARL